MQTRTQQIVQQIATAAGRVGTVRIMEVCGTHTVSLFRTGVKSLLPANIRLISGPGCPVCVTSQGYIDAACEIASRPGVAICTYGDMVRVPGQAGSLEEQRARGARIVVVYSARDAVHYAEAHPDLQVGFLAVGFETTTPGTAAAIIEAETKGLQNFFVLAGHKLVIPAMSALLSAGDVPVDGFLCPGHVSVIIGTNAYRPIAEHYRKPCVVAGFEPDQMLLGILRLVEQIADARGENGHGLTCQPQADSARPCHPAGPTRAPRVENVYGVAVGDDGNAHAQRLIDQVFEPADTIWRAMGVIPLSGLELRAQYKRFDALAHFGLTIGPDYDPPGCRCGEVIQGKVEPADCPLFAKRCTPSQPVGPCMVSSEGTCAAWYKYGRVKVTQEAEAPRH